MARNRKYQTSAVGFGAPVKVFLLCLLLGSSGIGYVWQKSQIDELGKQKGKREVRLREVQEQNIKLRKQLAEMRSPRYLDMRIKELKLGLGPVPLSQVCKLSEPAREPARPAAEAERQFAAQNPANPVLP